MNRRRRGWLPEDGWWKKEDWGIKVKFTAGAENWFPTANSDDHAKLWLQDAVQFATHVESTRNAKFGIEVLFDALDLRKASLLESITLDPADAAGLEKAIKSGHLRSLKHLRVHDSLHGLFTLDDSGDKAAKSLGVAIRSGELKNLAQLRLNHIRLTDEGLIALVDSFEEGAGRLVPNLSSLDLCFNSFTEKGLLSLSNALSSGKLPKLRCLWVSGNYIGDKGAKSLGVAIRSGELKNLAELRLKSIGLTNEGLIALTDSFQASLLPSLSSLDIGLNSVTAVGLLSLAEALSTGKLPNLSSLDISGNDFIGDEGAKSFGLAIRSGKLNNLAELKLKRIGLTDEGLIALTDSFQKGAASLLPNLSSLDIGLNSFTVVGLGSLAEALSSGKLPNLSSLDISGIDFIRNEGAKIIGPAIRSGNPKNLAVGVSNEGLVAVVHSFQEGVASVLQNLSSGKLFSLIYLDISGNQIGFDETKSLGLAIQSGELNKLAELKLNHIGLTDEGLIALTDSFQFRWGLLPYLSFLDIGNNSLTEAGLLVLAKALASESIPSLRPGLRCLIISGNDVGDEGAKSFGLAIRSGKLKNLAKLQLKRIGLTDEGLIALTDSFQEGVASLLPNLSSLDIGQNSFTAVGLLSLTEALSSGKLPNLRSLDISGIDFIRKEGAKIIGLAIRSGNVNNLAVGISNEGLIAVVDSFQNGVASVLRNLSSGKLSSLTYLDISGNQIGFDEIKSLGLVMQSGELKNLAELKLNQIGMTDEGLIALTDSFQYGVASLLRNLRFLDLSNNFFTEVGLLSLGQALTSGHLNSLKVLNVQHCIDRPSKEGACALVSAYLNNNCLIVDVEFEWYNFPDLDRRRAQLIERNLRHKDILAGLVTVPKVQATIGKVYLCGNPVVGKTTLRRTLQRSFWKSLFTWERRPHVENRTRGIDVSQLSSKGNKPDEDPITLRVWDMAGQEDFHVVHNAFFPDLGFAEGKATTFVVVCSSKNGRHDSLQQLGYWLRYIASSSDKTVQNPRQVFVVMNKFGKGPKVRFVQLAGQLAKCAMVPKEASARRYWNLVLQSNRDRFKQHLEIQTQLFLVDVRRFRQVDNLKRCLLEHSKNLLRNHKVPKICHIIQENLSKLSQQREQFPVLHWTGFVEQIQMQDYWPEQIIEATAKYLHEAGVVIYIDTEAVKLVVVDPNWLCREIIGNVFLPWHMASPTEELFRNQVDQTTGSISISNFKKFFKYMRGEWNEAQVDDLIAILLWLGLCYKGNGKGKDADIFLPALIAENGIPGQPWCVPDTILHGGDQWVMGFSVRHQKNEVALAPISLWHRFQVDLAQSPKFNGERPDNDFLADKYFVTFVVDYMNVLIEVDASEKPTFEEISILVKPSPESDELAAPERKQCQVDLADILVERLLKLWSKVCPGVEYEHKIIWPWPASCSRPTDIPERNIEVAKVQKWVKEHGVGTRMQWVVSQGNPITEDQLLSTKDKRKLGVPSISMNAEIKGHAQQVNNSIFELYKPNSNPKVQIVFFHGLQMDEYSDEHQHLSTWQSADGSTVWPQTWLVDDFPGAQVLSISYSGGLRYSSDGSLDMYLIGENLLSDLLQDGVGQVPHCPVVFVGHSIGGLVIKELCCRAHDKFNRSQGHKRAKLEKFLTNVGGVFFYATPHRGSGVAEILAKEISSPLLTYFETLSKDTARLNSDFEEMCNAHYKHWLFAGLGEAVPTTLGPLKAGVAPRKYMVVPEASARTENFNVVEEADHFSVCRPRSKTVRSFSKLRDFVSQIASQASDAEKTQPANPLLYQRSRSWPM